MNRLFTLILLFCIPFSSFSQNLDSFPESPANFLKELDKFLTSSDREDAAIIYSDFQRNVQSGAFTSGQFDNIRRLSNKMLDKRMRAYPYFNLFFSSLNNIVAQNLSSQQIDPYLEVCENLLDNLKQGKLLPYKKFLIFSNDLFDKNAIFYSKSGHYWEATTTDFTFKYENQNPVVYFENGDLICKRKEDSIVIRETSGTYSPLEYTWKGGKGIVSWERTDIPGVYCEFFDYKLEAKKKGYQADSAVFYHPQYFDEPVTGKLEDLLVIDKTSQSYPRFVSDASLIKIDNIGEGVKYVGGFSMFGTDVNGTGTKDDKASVYIFNKAGDLAIKTRSESFRIKKGENVVSKSAEVSIYFGQDSIFHPDINFKFDVVTGDLSISRGAQGSSKTPFVNSFHELDMTVETIGWNIETDSIEIGKAKLAGFKRSSIFESANFFNESKYRIFQNIADSNPISQMKIYCDEEGIDPNSEYREMDANLLAKRLNPRYHLSTIMSLLNSLVEEGFIYYDSESEMVSIKEKLFLWADASVGKVDHDVIRFVSSEEKDNNGILSLKDFSMNLRGVRNIIISDSQLVVVKPQMGNINIHKNRDMIWNGSVYGGYSIFYGKDFSFNYRNFAMGLNEVDSFLIRIPEGEDVDGTALLRPLTTKIENTSGYLQIDAPGNKSGRQNIHEYPSFKTNTKAFTYYKDSKVKKNAYNRDNFYFELDPFEFDSLDSFDPENVGFYGRMISAGIFPEFKEKLIIQKEDYSLGFVTQTPQEGYELYKGKGKYNLEIRLSNEGLTGRGTVTYLNSTLHSDDIVFLPDNLIAAARVFYIKEQERPIEYPEVNAEDVNVDWWPYKDSMYIKSKDEPFLFFDNEKKLDGDLVLTPGGLYGSGTLDWDEATMTSKFLLFGTNGVDADTCNLSIKSMDPNKLAFNTKNVKASLDFDLQNGSFEANSDDISTEMPYNQYKTSLNIFEWDMEGQVINFESKSGKAGSFLSTRKDQDSLLFTATSARYDLKTNLLEIDGVGSLTVADVTIYPPDGKLSIMANAEMNPLTEAKIVANNTNKYHTINRAEVKVNGKYDYRAKGYYEYNVGGHEQEILFNNISVLKKKGGTFATVGSGPVKESDNFYVDNSIKFKGTVNLSADSKNLEFDGYAQLQSPNMIRPKWFSIDSKIDRNNVVIGLNKPKTPLGERLHVGLALNQDSVVVYPRVLQIPYRSHDHKIFTASGVIVHDKGKREFLFGDSTKVIMKQRRGNILVFNEGSGKLTMEGRFDMASGFKNNVVIDAAGTAVTYYKGGPVSFNLIAGMQLPLPEKCLQILGDDLYNYGDNLPDVDNFEDWVKNAISELEPDDKKLIKTFENMDNELEVALPKEVNYNIFFNKFPMKWNDETLSLTTSGSIGIGTINGKGIHKVVKCYAEVIMMPTGDIFTLYIQSPSDDWYYMSYKNGVMRTLSSNEAYNDVLLSLKKKESRIRMPSGQDVELSLDNVNSVNYFRNRMRTR